MAAGRDIDAAMESVVISLHLVLIVNYAVRAGWFTMADASKRTRVVARTTRHHLKRLTDAGVLKRERAYGGCRYHMLSEAEMSEEAKAYMRRLLTMRKTWERPDGRIRTTLSSIAAILAIV